MFGVQELSTFSSPLSFATCCSYGNPVLSLPEMLGGNALGHLLTLFAFQTPQHSA